MTHADRPFTISAAPGRVRALFEGHEVADSDKALIVRESDGSPTYYFPPDDVQMSVLRRNDHAAVSAVGRRVCYTIARDARVVEDVAWSYEQTHDQSDLIEGYVAFSPAHVDIEADTTPQPVRRVPPMDPPYA